MKRKSRIIQFHSEKSFLEREQDFGFIATKWPRGVRLHRSGCWTLSRSGDRNHVTRYVHKYWGPDLGEMRSRWLHAFECGHCKPGKK
jgi:hypothetical protein